jgi:hypothetical protein
VNIPATNPSLISPTASASLAPSPVASEDAGSAHLAAGYAQLDRGLLTYTPLKTLRAGAPTEFHITVTDVGHGAELTSAPTLYHGQAVDPDDVAADTEVAVQIVCADGLTCQSQTSRTSQFVGPGQPGTWAWRLTAAKAGTALVGIVAVSYAADGDVFLHTTPVWTVALNVRAAAG